MEQRIRKEGRLGACHRLCALALGTIWLLAGMPASSAAGNGWRQASEEELRMAFARGLPERLLAGRSLYLGSGNAVEALGDLAALLNPVAALLDADATFRRLAYSPGSLAILVDAGGASYIRLSNTISEISLDRIRVRGTQGPSIGSVTLRGFDQRGTTIVVKKAP